MDWCGPVVLSPTGHSQKSCGWNTCLQSDDGDLVCYAPVLIQTVRKNSVGCNHQKTQSRPKKLILAVFEKKNPFFREKSVDSRSWEKIGLSEAKGGKISEKKADFWFSLLVYVWNFFSTKWVFVLMVKQRLRVFCGGNIARLDLFTNHDAANDSS